MNKIKISKPVKMKIKKGDKVEVVLGKDKGRQGKVREVFSREGKVLVEKINVVKKHVKAQSKDKPGGILETERPIFASKVAVICPDCKKKTRIAFQLTQKGKKIRVCRRCSGMLDGGKNAI